MTNSCTTTDFHVNVNVDFFYCRPPCHVARCFVIFWPPCRSPCLPPCRPPCPTPIFFVGHLFHIHANLWSLSDNSKVDNFLVSDNILKNILISFHESFKGGHSESTNGGVWKQMNISASWKNLFHLGKVSKMEKVRDAFPNKSGRMFGNLPTGPWPPFILKISVKVSTFLFFMVFWGGGFKYRYIWVRFLRTGILAKMCHLIKRKR